MSKDIKQRRKIVSVVVNTNTQSIFAQRALSRNTMDMQRNIEHLSTGFKINRAADDAAGLSISEKMTARIQGFAKAKQNASDGISMAQTADGSLGIIQENLQRIRELVVQGINGTYSQNEIDALQNEINQRIINIRDIGASTEFNGIALLDGTANRVLQTGADDGQTTTLNFASGGTVAQTGIAINIYAASETGNDFEHGHLTEGIQTGFALAELQLAGASVDSLAVLEGGGNIHTSGGTAGAAANFNIAINNTAAQVGLADLDTIIDNVSRMRSELGAVQNAIESKILYLDIARENAEASRSRIKDVDVAYESSNLVKNQILQQSASAMLSQANSQPQIALQLIGG